MNREILKIAVPAIVTNVTIPLLGLLDTAIAGHLDNSHGALYIGAVAVGAMMFNLIYWNFGFLRMGTSGLTAQAYGRGDEQEQVNILRYALSVALIISLSIIVLQWPLQWVALTLIGPGNEVRELALQYFYIGVWGAPPTMLMMAIKGWLIGMQNSRSPMIISIGVNVVNILFSLIAVFALGMGFTGIIVGTVVAEWLGLAYSLWLLRHKYQITTTLLPTAMSHRPQKFFRVNSDIFIRSSLMMIQALFFTAMGARSGDLILAANTLILQMAILFSYFMDGFAFAGEAIAGKYCGRGDKPSEWRCVNHLLGWAAILTTACVLLYAFFPAEILNLLTNDNQVIATTMNYRWWCAVIPIAGVLAFVWDGVFIGLTRTRAMTIAIALAFASFFLAYALVPASWGNHGLWLAYLAFLATRSVVQTLQYYRF